MYRWGLFSASEQGASSSSKGAPDAALPLLGADVCVCVCVRAQFGCDRAVCGCGCGCGRGFACLTLYDELLATYYLLLVCLDLYGAHALFSERLVWMRAIEPAVGQVFTY